MATPLTNKGGYVTTQSESRLSEFTVRACMLDTIDLH